jgi:hypothetical protein
MAWMAVSTVGVVTRVLALVGLAIDGLGDVTMLRGEGGVGTGSGLDGSDGA